MGEHAQFGGIFPSRAGSDQLALRTDEAFVGRNEEDEQHASAQGEGTKASLARHSKVTGCGEKSHGPRSCQQPLASSAMSCRAVRISVISLDKCIRF